MSGLHNDDVIKQSESAYKQWCVQWRKQAKENSKHHMRPFSEFYTSGFGRAVLCVANGYSFEENLETIKKYQDNVDIFCVDKSLKHLIENGIKPKFCLVADANVNYEKYLKPIESELSETTLIMNVCANPLWADNGNWKSKYFFVNKDVLKSELEFQQISGCPNIVAAATNVSNAAVVILTQCDNQIIQNYFGYDKILLIGFDYCWDENYYAFDKTGSGKTHYMRAITVYDLNNDLCYTSTNLLFSAKWLDKYIKAFSLPVFQCSKRSLVAGKKICKLDEQMQYSYRPDDAKTVISLIDCKHRAQSEILRVDKTLRDMTRDHYKSVIRTT